MRIYRKLLKSSLAVLFLVAFCFVCGTNQVSAAGSNIQGEINRYYGYRKSIACAESIKKTHAKVKPKCSDGHPYFYLPSSDAGQYGYGYDYCQKAKEGDGLTTLGNLNNISGAKVSAKIYSIYDGTSTSAKSNDCNLPSFLSAADPKYKSKMKANLLKSYMGKVTVNSCGNSSCSQNALSLGNDALKKSSSNANAFAKSIKKF